MTAALIDLAAITAEFLKQCGPCEFGVPGPCNCPKRDYRPAMSSLVSDIERFREALEALAKDCEDMPAEQVTPLMFAATATRIRLILAGQLP